jgi:hypothetical protein
MCQVFLDFTSPNHYEVSVSREAAVRTILTGTNKTLSWDIFIGLEANSIAPRFACASIAKNFAALAEPKD